MLSERQAPVKVLIIEDHVLVLDGIKSLLAMVPSFSVVAQVEDGLQAYQVCQDCSPDLVLIDLGLPGMDGIDVIRQLKRRWPALAIVVLTANATEYKAGEAIAAGALGYVLKKSTRQVFLAALQTVLMGKRFIDPSLNEQQLSIAQQEGQRAESVMLTRRERQILKLIAEGGRNRDIAERLAISLKTVETHRLNLMRKLDAHNIAELVAWANRLGLYEGGHVR